MKNPPIAALSTPPGPGFAGIVRLSGPGAFDVLQALHSGAPTHRGAADVALVVDDAGRTCPAALWIFPGPASYTGEDLVELHLWGGPVLLGMVLERALAHGARAAEPGEFTRRAFLNGKMDLARAESVLEVIHARTAETHRLALRQLEGSLSRAVEREYDALTELVGLIEAALDFSDQEIEIVQHARVIGEIERARAAVTAILHRSSTAEVADALPTVVLAGPAGAGKSTLFNRLVPGGRAIVSGVPGTTRDYRTGEADVGVRVRLVDTAGERATDDPVERAAIGRTGDLRESADVVVAVTEDPDAAPPAERTLRVRSKSDLHAASAPAGWIAVSAVTGAGLDDLRRAIARLVRGGDGEGAALYLLNVRQRDSLRRAAAALDRAAAAARADLGLEFVAYDLRGALDAFGELLGRVTPEDLLDRIFSRFCIGK